MNVNKKYLVSDIISYIAKKELYLESLSMLLKFNKDNFEQISRATNLHKIYFKDCNIFAENLTDLNKLLEYRNLIELDNCNIYIDRISFDYSIDETEEIARLLGYDDIEKQINNIIILNFNIRFKYYPQDFSRFSEIIKRIKIDNLNFNFDYSGDTKINERKPVPILHEFNNLLKSLTIRNAVLNQNIFPYTDDLFLCRCNGEFFSMSKEIHVDTCDIRRLKCFTGTRIYIENGSTVAVSSNGKFNIYFDAPMKYTRRDIKILSGSIKHTNKKDLLNTRPMIYKYQVFINQDFSDEDFITQFYHCKFFNCFFNSNQFILDSEFKKCFFSEGKKYVKFS